MFAAGTSEDDIRGEYIAHLSAVADSNPDDTVLAHIYFSRGISLAEYDSILAHSGLRSGTLSGYLAHIDGVAVIAESFPTELGEALPDGDRLGDSIEELARSRSYLESSGADEMPAIYIENLHVYSTPSRLQELWRQNMGTVRLVGVAGRIGQESVYWYNIRPTEAIR